MVGRRWDCVEYWGRALDGEERRRLIEHLARRPRLTPSAAVRAHERGADKRAAKARDRADAQVIVEVVRALRRWEEITGRAATLKPLREAVWFYWEGPRLPKPRIRGKYPRHAVPWSRAARAYPEGPLVIEHAEPVKLLLRRMLDDPQLDAAKVQAMLSLEGRWVIVTAAESRMLAAKGLAARMPTDAAPGDPWARHRIAGIDPADFAPLEDEP